MLSNQIPLNPQGFGIKTLKTRIKALIGSGLSVKRCLDKKAVDRPSDLLKERSQDSD